MSRLAFGSVLMLLAGCSGDDSDAFDGAICEFTQRCDVGLIAADLACLGVADGAPCGDDGTCAAERCSGHQVIVNGGPIMMGSPDGEGDSHEHPARLVTVPPFRADRYEVTNAQYGAFIQANGSLCPKDGFDHACIHDCGLSGLDCGNNFQPRQDCRGRNGDIGSCAGHPVTYVTWYGAWAYCKWAGRRLPTDAEWTRMANGPGGPDGTTFGRYPWGNACATVFNQPPGSKVDFDSLLSACSGPELLAGAANCSEKQCADGYALTAPIGSFPGGASGEGVHDLAGNAREWVYDCWHDIDEAKGIVTYDSAPTDGSAWVTDCSYPDPSAKDAFMSTVRGGGYQSDGRFIRSRSRGEMGLDGDVDVGFRCVRDL